MKRQRKLIEFKPGLVLESMRHYYILGSEAEEGIIYSCKIPKGSLGFLLLGDKNEVPFEFGEYYSNYISGCIRTKDMKPANRGIVNDIITVIESRGNDGLSYESKMLKEMGIDNIREISSEICLRKKN